MGNSSYTQIDLDELERQLEELWGNDDTRGLWIFARENLQRLRDALTVLGDAASDEAVRQAWDVVPPGWGGPKP